MFRFAVTCRALLALVCGALATLPSAPSLGQTTQHQFLQQFRPIPGEEVFPDPNFPFGENPSEFGYDVAIRIGLAFAGMPLTLGNRPSRHIQANSDRLGAQRHGDRIGQGRRRRIRPRGLLPRQPAGRGIQTRGLRRQASHRSVASTAEDRAACGGRGFQVCPPDLKHEAGVPAIGAWGEHLVPNATGRDSVYIFEQDPTGKFVRRARILSPSGHNDGFGGSISMTDSIIVVGSGSGAYILARNKNAQWVSRQRLVFLPGATQYVESFRLRPIGQIFVPFNFGMQIAISGNRIAVAAITQLEGEGAKGATVAIYSRVGSTVTSLGQVSTTSGSSLTSPTSIAIANNLLLVGSPFAGRCLFNDSCVGEANLFRMDPTAP